MIQETLQKTVRRIVILGIALAILVVGQWVAGAGRWVTSWWQAAPAAGKPAPAAAGVTQLAVRVQRIGTVPSSRVLFDPAMSNRLYAGGSVSNDGGQTWQPMLGADARTVAAVGGLRYERPCVVGPMGRLLCAEVLLQKPGEAAGQGDMAGAVEWTGAEWRTVIPAAEELALFRDTGERLVNDDGQKTTVTMVLEFQPLPLAMNVRTMAFLPDGGWVAAKRLELLASDGRTMFCPADVRDFAAGADGKMYFAADRESGIGMYVANGFGEQWLPVAGATRVVDLAEGSEDIYAATGQSLGRGRGTSFQWTPWTIQFNPEHVTAHPFAPLVAAWGRWSSDIVLLSRDGGRTLPRLDLPPTLRVAWVAFDPQSTDSLVVVDRTNVMHRVTLGS